MSTESSWTDFTKSYAPNATKFQSGFQADPNRLNQYWNNADAWSPMLDAYNQQTGSQAKFMGDDKVDFGDGQGAQDVLTADGGFWYGGSDSAKNGGPVVTADGRMTGASSQGSQVGSAPGAQAGGAGVDASMRDYLLKIMQQNQPHAIDPRTDPNLAPQLSAYDAERQRAGQRQRGATAERAAAEGLNSGGQGSGAFDSSVNAINEGVGRDVAGYSAGLVGQEMQAERAQLMQALGLAESVGARDQATQLRQQLAGMDDKFRYAQLGQQGSQFTSQLNQNQSQWNDRYGLDKTQLKYGMDRDALLSALGG